MWSARRSPEVGETGGRRRVDGGAHHDVELSADETITLTPGTETVAATPGTITIANGRHRAQLGHLHDPGARGGGRAHDHRRPSSEDDDSEVAVTITAPRAPSGSARRRPHRPPINNPPALNLAAVTDAATFELAFDERLQTIRGGDRHPLHELAAAAPSRREPGPRQGTLNYDKLQNLSPATARSGRHGRYDLTRPPDDDSHAVLQDRPATTSPRSPPARGRPRPIVNNTFNAASFSVSSTAEMAETKPRGHGRATP